MAKPDVNLEGKYHVIDKKCTGECWKCEFKYATCITEYEGNLNYPEEDIKE